jgi:hypothetical protein
MGLLFAFYNQTRSQRFTFAFFILCILATQKQGLGFHAIVISVKVFHRRKSLKNSGLEAKDVPNILYVSTAIKWKVTKHA